MAELTVRMVANVVESIVYEKGWTLQEAYISDSDAAITCRSNPYTIEVTIIELSLECREAVKLKLIASREGIEGAAGVDFLMFMNSFEELGITFETLRKDIRNLFEELNQRCVNILIQGRKIKDADSDT